MREGTSSDLPRKIQRKKTLETTIVSQSRRKKIETLMKISKGKEKQEKENSRLFEHKAFSSTSILLIYHSVLSSNKKKLYAFKTL